MFIELRSNKLGSSVGAEYLASREAHCAPLERKRIVGA